MSIPEQVPTPAAPVVAPVSPVTPAEDFSRAFDEAMADKPAATDTVTSPTAIDDAAAATRVAAAVVAAAVEPAQPAAPVVEVPVEPAATAVADPLAPATVAPSTDAEWKRKYEELAAQTKPKPDPAPTPAAPPAPPAPLPELYTAEEKATLESYAKEWPEIARGEALRRRAEYQEIAAHIFSEMSRVYGPVLQQAQQMTEQYADDSLLTSIQRKHSDYNDAMYNEIIGWASNLKGFKKTFAQSVIENGDPDAVVDLIDEFKRETGKTKPTLVTTPVAAPVATSAPTPALTEAAKQAAKAMGVVGSKRSTVPQAADPNDFDGAWKDAVNAE